MSQQLVNAYATHQQVQLDGREIDKNALLNCASRLKMAKDDGGKDMKMYQEAIRHNQHLLTIFQVALTDPSNELPNSLKVTLLRLSGYVDRVSFRAISEFMPQLIDSLIDINRIIATGLAKKQAQAASAASMPKADPMQIAGTPAAIMTSA